MVSTIAVLHLSLSLSLSLVLTTITTFRIKEHVFINECYGLFGGYITTLVIPFLVCAFFSRSQLFSNLCVIYKINKGSVGWGYRRHQLHLCRGVKLPPIPGYDTKQSDGETSGMLELWGIWSTPSLPLLPRPLWLRIVAPDRVLSIGQIEPFGIKTMYSCWTELFEIELFDHLTVYKQMTDV